MTPFVAAEEHVVAAVSWLRLGVELVGASIVAMGVLAGVRRVARAFRDATGFHDIRISFARYLALALEFQLAADILSTAIAPSWDQIGKLAAIAVIRTLLNYFLIREMREVSEASPAGAHR